MSLARRSIQGRLLLLLLAGMAAVWLAAAVVSWRDVRHELDELLDAHLAQAAALLVVQQAGEIEHDDDARTLDAPQLHRYAPRAVFQVFHEGRLVLRSADAPRRALLEPGASGFATVRSEGRGWRVFATRGAESDVQVFVGERLDAREDILRAALTGTLWPLGASLPLLALLAWGSIRNGLAPLRALGAQLAARRADSRQPVTLGREPSELAPLLAALNGLFGRIDKMLEAERRFTADAAHELRTPIAAIRAQAQVALGRRGASEDEGDGAETADAAERRHALRATLQGCDRAAHLVDQLLMLSQLEAGANVPLEPVSLSAIAREVVAELAPRAIEKQQDLGVDAAGAGRLRGAATLLAVLVRNLVDNALRYSPRGARIELSVRDEGARVSLRVEDSGPGLGEAAMARLGQRFNRGLGHEESGSGLGWSIVRRIAEVHGLEVMVEHSKALGGLAVNVSGPAA